MKRNKAATTALDESHDVLVYRFGLRDPIDWGDDCDGEAHRMNALWNRLVDIEAAHRQKVRDLTADDPEVVALRAELEAAQHELNEAIAERNRLRKEARKRIPTPELDERIAALKAKIKEIIRKLSEAARRARAEREPELKALQDERYAAVTHARQTSGLYWGNYNAVLNDFETAAARARKTGAALRFRNWRSDARFVVQIIGGMTTEELFDGSKSQIAADRKPETHGRPGGYCRLLMTLFTVDRKPRHVTWPIFLDRPFPDGARIQQAIVTRRRRADKWSWHIAFLLRIPKALPAADDAAACGIDVGWRVINDGLRVATLVNAQGEREFLVLPAEIIDAVRRSESLQTKRDEALAALLPVLRPLDWANAPSPLGSLAQPLSRAKTGADALHDLVLAWRKLPDWQPEAFAHADAWLAADKIRNQYLVNTRRRALARRLDIYRNAAKRWAQRYGVIGIEDLNMAQMLTREAPNGEPQDVTRWHARLAVPGELLGTIKQAAKKAGARVYEHEGKSTWPCADCRDEGRTTVVTPSEPAALIQTCSHSHAWDQDVNAARNLLAAAIASGPVPPETPPPLAPRKPGEINDMDSGVGYHGSI